MDTENLDIARLPSFEELRELFAAASASEKPTGYLDNAYRTGVAFDVDGRREMLNETCMQMPEGLVLWHVIRRLRPPTVIETGFGRGGSSAFFLSALYPWRGRLISIDPAFRHWAGDTGITYIKELGLSDSHELIEVPSEFALAERISEYPENKIKVAYVDGSHHFDGTLIDFVYFDKILEVGGVIGIDDAHAPAVRTVASFVANNLPYKLHYPTQRLVLCQKVAETDREWGHFRPFSCSPNSDWSVHSDVPTSKEVPNATFGPWVNTVKDNRRG